MRRLGRIWKRGKWTVTCIFHPKEERQLGIAFRGNVAWAKKMWGKDAIDSCGPVKHIKVGNVPLGVAELEQGVILNVDDMRQQVTHVVENGESKTFPDDDYEKMIEDNSVEGAAEHAGDIARVLGEAGFECS